MSAADVFLKWLAVRDGRGIIRKGGHYIAKDLKTGDVCSAHTPERLAQILSADPELPKATLQNG